VKEGEHPFLKTVVFYNNEGTALPEVLLGIGLETIGCGPCLEEGRGVVLVEFDLVIKRICDTGWKTTL